MNSHDVRNLRECQVCRGLGAHLSKNSTIRPVIKYSKHVGVEGYAHPDCYVRRHGTFALLAGATKEELSTIRICDVSRYVMKKVLAQLVELNTAVEETE